MLAKLATDLRVVDSDELVTQGTDLTVHDKTLEIDVRSTEKSETRSLVAATRLDTDETVLDDINTANTVAAGNGIGSQEQLDRVGDSLLLAALSVIELHGNTLLEVHNKVLRLLRGLQRVNSQLPHVGGGGGVRVLEDTGLVRAVGQVLVHTPGLGLGRGHRNVLLGGIVEQGVTASEAVVENGVTPRCDNLDVGLQGVESQLETNLVVALTGAAVRNGSSALPLLQAFSGSFSSYLTGSTNLGNLNLGTGNNGTSERSAYSYQFHSNTFNIRLLSTYPAGRRSRRWHCKQWRGSKAPPRIPL